MEVFPFSLYMSVDVCIDVTDQLELDDTDARYLSCLVPIKGTFHIQLYNPPHLELDAYVHENELLFVQSPAFMHIPFTNGCVDDDVMVVIIPEI